MSAIPYSNALIIGAGFGISAALTRHLRSAGLPVAIASRRPDRLAPLVTETGAIALPVDASDSSQIERLFVEVEARIGAPEIVIYNASSMVRGPIADVDPMQVERAIAVTALGAFHAVQHAAKRMLPFGKGAILMTGATAGIKGFPRSAAFAMGKFALRGLAQSASRELTPQGIHVAHIVVDGTVGTNGKSDPSDRTLSPDALAQCYMDLLRQHRSTWSWEIEVRPWLENF
ncbi:short chain dehydrogenase/reductase family oxidoreductase [Caballeronia sordidicola]|uniref:Short chain dehydrogenase/reductase family oxidoreductase n=1 Tax=Caballeronia sordidicola TaxID=196367 RepID=A0A158EQ01_CABSO|nr:SDR family NAD(P)-dependent oxidoreductase [Caballeronia sordidicola]SAL09662.1 short chain dehydrogenase/reductase family oxidoreductase [Caballeronia sordidicola]